MRIAVFGSGGVGGYFGGRLAQSGEEVTFIARGQHLEALQHGGLHVDSIKGDFHIQPVDATSAPDQVGKVDWILVAVKAWQVEEAALAMRPMLGEQTGVVPLCNGVDAPAQLVEALGKEHVLGGLCRISSFIVKPGHIRHGGIEPYVAIGELDQRRSSRIETLRQAFERAGVNVATPEDIQVAMWEKFIFIASISGMGAVTRTPAAIFRSLPETRQMLEQTIDEIVNVARSRQVRLPQDASTRTINIIDGLPMDVLASMQRDIMEGRPSELDAQNGAVVRMGQEAGTHTAVNAFIYHSLLPQELKARCVLKY